VCQGACAFGRDDGGAASSWNTVRRSTWAAATGLLLSRQRLGTVAAVFDPVTISDDACADGHLDTDAIYAVLQGLGKGAVTGRLTIADAAGDNHMYFMQGRPVGVHLAEHFHPLGQLLLELGRMSGATFVRAQRLIAEGNRLPGQVYKELGVLDDNSLKEVLAIQARRKAEHFCRLGSRPFRFCKGLTYLTGFTSTPLDPHAVIYLAVRQQMGEQAREAFLDAARLEQVCVAADGNNSGLPAPLANFGFGPPEERFLQRVVNTWAGVAELAETGTLPREEMAVLLRYLEVVGRLQRRALPPALPLPPPTPPTPPPVAFALPRVSTPTPLDVVRPRTVVPGLAGGQRPAPPSSPFLAPPSAVTAPLQQRPPELDALQRAPLVEPTSEDVFSPKKPAAAAPPPRPLFSPDAATDPRRPAVAPRPIDPAFVSALNEPTPQSMPSPAALADDMPVPVVKKKKVKRLEPLPSEASGVLMSETRREKTMIAELPSIVIDDDE
jgi:hypothetical protein